MTFYVKLMPPGAQRFRFLTEAGGSSARRKDARRFPDRDAALACARRLREERLSCQARVVNDKGHERPLTVTEQFPGVTKVAEATGLPAEVVRQLARLRGCPLARGGRGYRFASVEAFKGFLAGLTHEQRLSVPAFCAELKTKLCEEIGKLAWGMDRGEWNRLMRRSYDDLVRLRDDWKARGAADKARLAGVPT